MTSTLSLTGSSSIGVDTTMTIMRKFIMVTLMGPICNGNTHWAQEGSQDSGRNPSFLSLTGSSHIRMDIVMTMMRKSITVTLMGLECNGSTHWTQEDSQDSGPNPSFLTT